MLVVLVGLQRLLAGLSRSPRLAPLVNRDPVLLISDGRQHANALRRARVSEDELRQCLRLAGLPTGVKCEWRSSNGPAKSASCERATTSNRGSSTTYPESTDVREPCDEGPDSVVAPPLCNGGRRQANQERQPAESHLADAFANSRNQILRDLGHAVRLLRVASKHLE